MSKSLAKSTSLVSGMTFISRILGFIRDMVAAQIFGADAAADAFYVAFKIPNFWRNLFAEGSFSQAFVPVLSDYRQNRTPEEVRALIAAVSGGLGSILLGMTILGLIGSPILISIFGPGLDPYRFHLASEMLRITFPYLMLISLAAFVGSILNSYGKFAVPAFTPALLNICLIGTAFGVTHYFTVPIEAQAWGVLLAGFVQLFFQLPFLKQLGFLTMPRINWRDPGVQRILKLMLPALFGASAYQISVLVNSIFASFLPIGSVSWLYYSDRLAYFPLGVFGVALATVVLPQLARQHAGASKKAFASTLDWGIRCNLLIGIPASLAMVLLSGPLILSLFQHGQFTVHDMWMTQRSVIAYSVGLLAFMLVKVMSSAFYAQQDIKTPVRFAVITLVINIILNATLIFPLAHAGLALASSCASWCNVFLLAWGLHKRGVYQLQPGWQIFGLRLLVANSVLALFLWWGAGSTEHWIAWGALTRFAHVMLLGVAAIGVYIAVLWLMGIRFQDFKVKEHDEV